MTRRSDQFRRLAESTDAAIRFRRLAVAPAMVDQLLNERIDRVAELMGGDTAHGTAVRAG